MTRTIQVFIACAMLLFITEQVQAQVGLITSTNSIDGFFDSSSGMRDFTFDLADFGGGSTTITDVDISISFAKSNNNSFVPEGVSISAGTPFLDEIEFVLTSPQGTNVTLIANDFGTELVAADSFRTFSSGLEGFQGTILFDQSAPNPVDFDVDLLNAGTFRPDDDAAGSLDSFIGESGLGTFSLFIEDDIGSDGLSFYEASLIITTSTAVPEPSSISILCIAACAAGSARRRRR